MFVFLKIWKMIEFTKEENVLMNKTKEKNF